MSEVKRYDAVHLRYEGNNIRYGEGCEVEVVPASDYDALAAECERLRDEMHDLHTTMMAAAVEIQEHWAAHCDAEGYGPANLMRRLEHGIASQYGYDAETLVRIESQRDAALAELASAQASAWVPVSERLPESGRTVLAYYLNSLGMSRTIRAQHVNAWTIQAEDVADPDIECVEYSEQEEAYYLLEGWYECIDNWDDYSRVAVNEGPITHWQPLPAAPTPGASDGKG